MTNTTYNYLIRLQPLDAYFFGGEVTFGNGAGQNYFAKTNPFPQQTAILGVLRHLGYKKVAIGESFDATNASQRQDFGYIRNLSPLFLQYEGSKYYIPGALGSGPEGAFKVSSSGDHIRAWGGEDWKSTRDAPDYKAKDGWEQGLIIGQPTGNKKVDYIKMDQVIKTFTRIGITKNKHGQERKDGFYKQAMARLAKNWEFVVLADLDDEAVGQLPHQIVMPLGAEKVLFNLKVEKLNASKAFSDYFPPERWNHHFPSTSEAVILVSDAFTDTGIYSTCDFAITDTADFRNIRTPKNVSNFGRLKQFARHSPDPVDQLFKSNKYNLLKRGSLLYGMASDITQKLDKEAFLQIGYNHSFILTNI